MAMAMRTLVDVGDNWLLLCEVRPLAAARLPSLAIAAFRHFIKSSCGQTCASPTLSSLSSNRLSRHFVVSILEDPEAESKIGGLSRVFFKRNFLGNLANSFVLRTQRSKSEAFYNKPSVITRKEVNP